MKTYGHVLSTSFRIDEQDISRADVERCAAEESGWDALPVCY